MADDKDSIQETNASEPHDVRSVPENTTAQAPNYLARFFAIMLLVITLPVLLFAGYCAMAGAATGLGLIGIGIFAVIAIVAYQGVRALWNIHEAPEGTGWIVALVLLAIAMGTLALWISQMR